MSTVVTPGGGRATLKTFPLERAGSPQNIGPTRGSIPILGRDFITLSYEVMVKRQPWIYVGVNKRATGIARLPLKAYRITDTDGNRERVRDHPALDLLSTPYPFGSAWDLKESIIGQLWIHGNALLVKFRGAGRAVKEIWPVDWSAIRLETGTSPRDVRRYWFRSDKGELPIERADAIHFRKLNGVSPMEPLRATLQIEDAAQRWTASTFANAAAPVGAFQTDKKLDPNSMTRLRAELERLYSGPDNAGRFGLFDQGLEWKQIAMSMVDVALIDQRKLNREEVMGVLDLPPPTVQILDHATFSNINEQHKMLYMDSYGPDLTYVEETLQAQLLVPDFGGEIFVEFDLAEVLKADVQARADAYSKLLDVMSVNEIRKLENLPPIGDPKDPENPFNKPWPNTARAPGGVPLAPAPDAGLNALLSILGSRNGHQETPAPVQA